MFNWVEVATLLDVVHKAATAGPAYTWFGDQAFAQLQKIKQAQIDDWNKSEPQPKLDFDETPHESIRRYKNG